MKGSLDSLLIENRPWTRSVFQGKAFIDSALANSRDAIKVLKEGVFLLFPAAQQELARAQAFQKAARKSTNLSKRNALLKEANASLLSARSSIVVE